MEIINEFSWTVGGPQGTGVDSAANLFLKSCAMAGLNCYSKREYHSTIKTSHSYTSVRVSERNVRSHIDPVHLLTTFEKTAPPIHAHEIIPGGAIIYDPDVTDPEELNLHPEVKRVALSYKEVLEKIAEELGLPAAKVQIMKNTVSVGATMALVDFDMKYVEEALKATFTGRKAKLVDGNVKAAQIAFDHVKATGVGDEFPYRLKPIPDAPERYVITGTTATALGKLKAGCKFQTYYPITPASDESVFLEAQQAKYGINVVQCEDEIASVVMAVGGALTGVRSATSTSCPGFGLMAEGIGWAAINEVPFVIFDYQRGGPATGLPTRHEQGDLLFSKFISHGNPPRIVLAPGSMSEYFYYAFEAFNYADKYQTPVIVVTDKCLGNNTKTVAPFDESKLKIDRGKMITDEELERLSQVEGFPGYFKRFEFSEDGISKRPVLGQKHGIHWVTGDESDEYGHITEDPENRLKMMIKRLKKMETALKEIPEEQQYTLHGPEDADITVLTWGSTTGPLLDAMPVLADENIKFNILQVRLMSPFPVEPVSRILNKAKVKVGFEMNQDAQLAMLTRMETGIDVDHKVLKWTGRPISETEACDALREIATKKSEEVVLTYGQ